MSGDMNPESNIATFCFGWIVSYNVQLFNQTSTNKPQFCCVLFQRHENNLTGIEPIGFIIFSIIILANLLANFSESEFSRITDRYHKLQGQPTANTWAKNSNIKLIQHTRQLVLTCLQTICDEDETRLARGPSSGSLGQNG